MEALADFRPEWHHIFPRKYLEGSVPENLVDALANIAVIGPEINIRISAKDPLSYVQKYKITDEKLRQQLIDPNFVNVLLTGFEPWLKDRAQRLADEGNRFLEELSRAL